MRLAGRKHVVVGLRLLQDQPHAFDVVARVPPVALRVEIADVQVLLPPELDRRHRAGDLARDEGLAARRPFVVEEDAVAGVEAVGLAVVDRDPVGVELRRRVRRAGVERRGLASAASPAPCRRAPRSRPDRSARGPSCPGCGSPPAAAACRARRRSPCIPASRRRPRRGTAPRGCRSRWAGLPARCGSGSSHRSCRRSA